MPFERIALLWGKIVEIAMDFLLRRRAAENGLSNPMSCFWPTYSAETAPLLGGLLLIFLFNSQVQNSTAGIIDRLDTFTNHHTIFWCRIFANNVSKGILHKSNHLPLFNTIG